MNVLSKAEVSCSNVSSSQNNCTTGFEPLNGNCYKVLNDTYNYWKASTEACADYLSTLVEFDDDMEVIGLRNLINKGIQTKISIIDFRGIVYH